MSWWEQFIISAFLGVLHVVIKNPAKQAAVRADLLAIADDIYTSYGVTPPAHT